ncbi:nucleotidyltransferase domain-containing protein [Bacillus sp. S/N-304-OC-R1]|uniref:nucleotidyltransferase domain-containing protein n=1 Tax=Bacillus sp. S/N-304-OC-R1 TaxID=2758034 RepID=UPI0021B081A4|nr:nucleotidyltransferase domain-containing protein [Bacillus sp. S/N-304-OC-R1]
MQNAVYDLKNNPNVLGIYLAGSLANGNFDHYSDIDLHVIVKPESKQDFINQKCIFPQNWGEVLFFENSSQSSPVVVTHFKCFVKVDSWYHTPNETTPSIWLKNIQALYDPQSIIKKLIQASNSIRYEPDDANVEFWRTKIVAFIHQTYRAVMRNELNYAMANLDRIRWLMVYGWYMEKNIHVDGSYGDWSKLEGNRSELSNSQLFLLTSWDCQRDTGRIMTTIEKIVPEFLKLNKALSLKTEIADNEDKIIQMIDMVL